MDYKAGKEKFIKAGGWGYLTMGKFEEKIVIITGAGRGIGRSIAIDFAKEGAKVVVVSRTESELKEVCKTIRELNGECLVVKTDISNFSNIKDMVDKVVRKFSKIDILINNAAVGMTKPMMNLKWKDWDLILDINIRGTFFVLQEVARKMIEIDNGGSIVNIASIAGEGGRPLFLPYAASKAAVINMTQSTSLELAKYNIRVNAVAPGTIDTKLWEDISQKLAELEKKDVSNIIDSWIKKIPLKRLAKPEDIASTVLFLCSDEAVYITGQTLNVCGGLSI